MAVSIPAEGEATAALESRAQVERILHSRIFRSSEVLRHLFAYLCDRSIEGTADTLKEYTIGIDALGKPETFDPRQESVVRMHSARLRQKLAEYYRTEGIQDPIVVDMPKGGFRITFDPRPQPVVAPVAEQPVAHMAPPSVETPKTWRKREIILAAALALSLIGGVVVGTRLWLVEKADGTTSDNWTPALKELWAPLLSSGRRLVVCVSTPLFVKLPGFGVLREPSVNDWDQVSGSPQLSAVEGALRSGITEPSYSYTEAGTATGAFLLGQFLAPHKQSVLITRANALSWPELAEDNVIFLGPATGVHQTEDIPSGAQLVLESKGIRNMSPKNGEVAFMEDHPAEGGAESGETYALISRVPAMNGPGAILMLSGNQTPSVMGGVQAFTNPGLAEMLVSHLKAQSGTVPKYFQVVLKVKAMDDVPVKISYVFHHELVERNTHGKY